MKAYKIGDRFLDGLGHEWIVVLVDGAIVHAVPAYAPSSKSARFWVSETRPL